MTESTSPFHPGERDIQARLGIEDKMLEPGRRMIRSTMPEQHKEFYAQLPMFFIGGADGGQSDLGVSCDGRARLRIGNIRYRAVDQGTPGSWRPAV